MCPPRGEEVMNKPFGNEDPALARYVQGLYEPEDPILCEIRERCAREGLPDIQVAALDGRHLEVIARLVVMFSSPHRRIGWSVLAARSRSVPSVAILGFACFGERGRTASFTR